MLEGITLIQFKLIYYHKLACLSNLHYVYHMVDINLMVLIGVVMGLWFGVEDKRITRVSLKELIKQ